MRGDFADAVGTSYEKSSGGTVVALDASMLVETRSRLLQSQQLARRVVERLGLERIRPAVSEGLFSSWLGAKFYGDARAPGYPEDIAAKRLLRGLSVKTEPRVYLITVRYTAGDPELAALITNAFVAEFLQTTRLRTLFLQRDLAQQALSERSRNARRKASKGTRSKNASRGGGCPSENGAEQDNRRRLSALPAGT